MHEIKQPHVQLQPFISHEPAYTHNGINAKLRERQKWKTTLSSFVVLACTVLLINTGFIAWAVHTKGTTDGLGVLYEGSCESTKKTNIGVHLIINILSSALLGASNYCMQCLSAPTRPEVDKAHYTGNCYNSVVFMSLSAQTYAVIQFGPEAKAAIENGSFDGSLNTTLFQESSAYLNGLFYSEAYQTGQLEELTLLECIDAYSTPFQATRGNVFLVVDEGLMGVNEAVGTFPVIERSGQCSAETSTKWIYQQFGSEASSCFAQDGSRFLPRLKADPTTWTPFLGLPVKRCLSQPTGQKCTLKFSVHLAIIVIIFNIVKALTVLAGIFELQNDPMLTVGDAVASFLQTPDSSSKHMCLVSQAEIHHAKQQWPELRQARAYTKKRFTWASSIKKSKRVMVWLSLSSAIVVLSSLFIWGYAAIGTQKNISNVLRIGLQSNDPRTIIQSGTAATGLAGVFQNVFVANSPQVIISLVYFTYNGAITSMLLAHEWSGFFRGPKTLSVESSLWSPKKHILSTTSVSLRATPTWMFCTAALASISESLCRVCTTIQHVQHTRQLRDVLARGF
ncbi:hypothetical protein IQ06DRAFT_361376 [Phaeosphaeriaceae sp. SRC1lsM3a]|nr:hypothetical protein IQ06DRAFT_361376 [Stagonospora sp. SRC1lsM3a]